MANRNGSDPRLVDLVRPRGVRFPFSKGPDGIPASEGPPNIYASNVKQALLTIPGERVMRPRFGSRIRDAVYSAVTSQGTVEFVRSEVTRAISAFEPRVSILNLNVTVNEARSEIKVKIALGTPVGLSSVDITVED